jgi:hypothetical protein
MIVGALLLIALLGLHRAMPRKQVLVQRETK